MDKTPLSVIKEAHASYARLRVLNAVSQGCRADQIARQLGINPSNAKRRIYVLERHGLIEKGIKTKYQEWRLTTAGKFDLQHVRNRFRSRTPEEVLEYEINYRYHHLMLRVQILRKNPEYLRDIQNQGFKATQHGKIAGWMLKMPNEWKLFLTGSSLLIFPKPIYAKSIEQAAEELLTEGLKIIEKCRRMFPLIEFHERITRCREHLAMIGGITKLIPEGFNYRSERLCIDSSTGYPEIEAISKWSVEDMLKITSFLEEIIRAKGNKEM